MSRDRFGEQRGAMRGPGPGLRLLLCLPCLNLRLLGLVQAWRQREAWAPLKDGRHRLKPSISTGKAATRRH